MNPYFSEVSKTYCLSEDRQHKLKAKRKRSFFEYLIILGIMSKAAPSQEYRPGETKISVYPGRACGQLHRNQHFTIEY